MRDQTVLEKQPPGAGGDESEGDIHVIKKCQMNTDDGEQGLSEESHGDKATCRLEKMCWPPGHTPNVRNHDGCRCANGFD